MEIIRTAAALHGSAELATTRRYLLRAADKGIAQRSFLSAVR
ncbi:hypothetical protein T261_02605 [Streptomyces lydicus]|nr:hypothetical protein T261_02605 [Streptomyces lydicus]